MSLIASLPAGGTMQDVLHREKLILDYARQGLVQWALSKVVYEENGHRVEFLVQSQGMLLEGVYLSMSATLAQQIADLNGLMLPTAKMGDIIFRQAEKRLEPMTQVINASKAGMLEQSSRLHDKIGNVSADTLVADIGKDWVLSNKLSTSTAANYGWHTDEQNWKGVRCDPAVTFPEQPGAWVIQSVGTRHSPQHSDYCLDPDTRVLTADLHWIRVGDVKIGDELIGFDEKRIEPATRPKLRGAVVEGIRIVRQPCYEVITDKATVIASSLHRWLVRRGTKVRTKSGTKMKTGWVPTSNLRVGNQIPFLCPPWNVDTSWDGGWMSGFLDGEGWISGTSGGFGQMPGPILERAKSMLVHHGIPYYEHTNKAGCVSVRGSGPRGYLRILGTFRPFRLMQKGRQAWENRMAYGGGRLGDETYGEVLEVRPVGVRTVIGVQTSTNTLIAEGLLSHNSQVQRLVSTAASYDGQPISLGALLQSSAGSILSSEGPLKYIRQPGVPGPAKKSRGKAFAAAAVAGVVLGAVLA